MGDDRVATENYLDIATANEFCYITPGSGMNDGGAEDKKNLPTMCWCPLHLACNFVNSQHLRFFGRNATLHEGK